MDAKELLMWKEEGLSLGEISLLTGVHRDTLRYRYNVLNIPYNLSKSKWDISKLKDSKDVDGQYVIGLLAADGYLDVRNVSIMIQERDVELLQRIRVVLGRPEANITSRVTKIGSRQVCMTISSVELLHFLTDTYGFKPRKSRTLPFPTQLENPLPYLRGFFDGDGYMGQSCTFTVGSENFAEGLMDWVSKTYGYRPNVQMVGVKRDIYNIHFRKRHEDFIRDLFSYPGLTRKTQEFLEYLPK